MKTLTKRKNALKIISFVLIFSIMMSSFMIVNANPYWQDGAKYGNVEVKYSYEESHPIPKVVAYLKNKYRNHLNITNFEAEIPHINVHLFYKGEDIANAHIVLYHCPRCGELHYLVYMKPLNRVIYDTKCNDDDDLNGKATKAWDAIKEYFSTQLVANGGSWVDQIMLTLVIISVAAALVLAIAGLSILLLPALA